MTSNPLLYLQDEIHTYGGSVTDIYCTYLQCEIHPYRGSVMLREELMHISFYDGCLSGPQLTDH